MSQRERTLSDGLKLFLDDLLNDLRIVGSYEGKDWVSADGELRITLPYGTWRWGQARGDELLGMVAIARKEGTRAARVWVEEWLGRRDPTWREKPKTRIKKIKLSNSAPTPEAWDRLAREWPDLTSPDLWHRFGVQEPWRPTAVYTYTDAAGLPLVLSCRLEHPDPALGKVFAHAAHYGVDGWRRVAGHRVLAEPLPLYNMGELAARAADPVLVVEGEKAAEAAKILFPEYVVTTWLGGANRALRADWSLLRGRKVVLLGDNDDAGREAAVKIVALLRHRYTPWAQRVPTESMRLPQGWDIADDFPGEFSLAHLKFEVEKAFGIPDWLAYMNARYIVANYQGRAVIYSRVEYTGPRPLERKTARWLPITEEDLHLLYANKLTAGVDRRGNPVMVPWSSAWLQHEQRNEAARVVFTAQDPGPYTLNLFEGFDPLPAPGEHRLPRTFLRYVWKVLCSGRSAEFKAVMHMLAELIQRPDEPWGKALVLKGLKGTGKTTFMRLVCDLVPAHSVLHVNYEHAMSRYNDWLRGTVVVCFDEALYAGDKKHESYLKSMITGDTLQIEGKYQGQSSIPNVSHVILAGNPERIVNATADERRYIVLELNEGHRQDFRYYNGLFEAWKDGEREQLMALLRRIDTSRTERREIEPNVELVEQQLESLDDLRQWLLYMYVHKRWWQTEAHPAEIEAWYLEWAKEHGRMNGHLIQSGSFFVRLKGILRGSYKSISTTRNGKRLRIIKLPALVNLPEIVLPNYASLGAVARNQLMDIGLHSVGENSDFIDDNERIQKSGI